MTIQQGEYLTDSHGTFQQIFSATINFLLYINVSQYYLKIVIIQIATKWHRHLE